MYKILMLIRILIKAMKEHMVLPNLLDRKFKQKIPGKVLLTDITYLFYDNSNEVYIKPCTTLESLKKEIKQYMIYYNNNRYQWN